MPHLRLLNLVRATGLVALVTCGPVAVAGTLPRDYQLTIAGFEHGREVSVRDASLRAERWVRRLGRFGDAAGGLVIVPTGYAGATPGETVAEVPADGDVLPLLVRAAWWRRFAREQPGYGRAMVPGWLVAGTVFFADQGDPSPLVVQSFPACKLLAEAGRIPDFLQLVDQPVGPEFPVFFRLYAEFCGCLLRVLSEDAPGLLQALVAGYNPGRSPSANLQRCLPGTAGSSRADALAWFGRRFVQVSITRSDALAYDVVRERLAELESVPILVPGEGGRHGIKRVPIDDVQRYLRNYRFETPQLDALRGGFLVLRQDCPPLLRPALDEYLSAVEELRQGDRRGFRKRLAKARAEFGKAHAFGLRVASLLGETADAQPVDRSRFWRYGEILHMDDDRLPLYLKRVEARLDRAAPPPASVD